jgi:hypothetical protein
MVCYAHFKEDLKDTDCHTPMVWDIDSYSELSRNGYATYLATLTGSNAAAISSVIPLPVTSTTTAYVSPAQKDDNAALNSWNRKPRDVAKYPLLKNDADYQD